jgi:hypothetical protein
VQIKIVGETRCNFLSPAITFLEFQDDVKWVVGGSRDLAGTGNIYVRVVEGAAVLRRFFLMDGGQRADGNLRSHRAGGRGSVELVSSSISKHQNLEPAGGWVCLTST